MNKIAICLFSLCCIVPTAAFADSKNATESTISPEMEQQINDLSTQLSYQLKSSIKVMNDPEVIKAQAKHAKSLYEAFIAEGFTKEQSLELVKVSISNKK